MRTFEYKHIRFSFLFQMSNISDINTGILKEASEVVGILPYRPWGGIGFGTTVLIISILSASVFLRCKHIESQFKILYANLLLSDSIFGLLVIITPLMHYASVFVCSTVFICITSSYFVYLVTITVICGDRMISLWKATPYLMRFSNHRIVIVSVCIWLVSFLSRASVFVDGFQVARDKCEAAISHLGPIGAMILFVTVVIAMILCITFMVITMILQRKHLRIMTNAPVVQERHVLQEYVKTTLKEMTIYILSLILFLPVPVWYLLFYIGKYRQEYTVYQVSYGLPFVIRVFSSVVIVAVRYPEFRYKMPKMVLFFSQGIKRWCDKKLEVYYPTIPNPGELELCEIKQASAECQECSDQAQNNAGSSSDQTSCLKHIKLRNVIAPWDDI